MPNRRFALDTSGYDGSQVNVVKRTFAQRFPRSAHQLSTKPLKIPEVELARDQHAKRGKTRFFIRNKKTTTTEAEEFFQRYEGWMLRTCLNNSKGLSDIDADNLLIRLLEDPIGTKAPNKDDIVLWKAIPGIQVAVTGTASATATATGTATTAPRRSSRVAGAPTAPPPVVNIVRHEATPLQDKYEHYQKDLYVMFRVNVPEYIDGPGRSALTSYVDTDNNHRTENDTSLNDTNFLDAGKRLAWDDIKKFILDNICCKPRKGDKLFVFRTTLRQDNTLLPLWMDSVRQLLTVAENEGAPYEAVATPEAMSLATRWVMPAEKKMLEDEALRGPDSGTYRTFDDIVDKMPLKMFDEYVRQLQSDKLPTNFKQIRSKAALKESLFSYEDMQTRIGNSTDELRSRVKYLEGKLEESNRKVVHLSKREKIVVRKLKEQDGSTALTEITPAATTQHPFGLKTKSYYCQLCWDKGLTKRKHLESKCDPKLREEAAARAQARKLKHKQAQEAMKQLKLNKNANQGVKAKQAGPPGAERRRYPLSSYLTWHCKWCKKEDVKPKLCKHKPEVCFRREGGPLDQENITDPKARERRSRELAAEQSAKSKAKRQGSTNKSVKLATTTQSEAVVKVASKSMRWPTCKQPKTGWTAEQKARLSEYNHWVPQYLHSKEYMARPLTHEEINMILPTDLRCSEFMGITAKHYFGRAGNERQLFRLRSDTDAVIKEFRAHNHKRIEEVRKNKTETSDIRDSLDKKYEGATAPAPMPATATTRAVGGIDNLGYVPSSPAYVPATKRPKINEASNKAAITITRKYAKGKPKKQTVTVNDLSAADRDELEDMFEGPVGDIDSDHLPSDDDAPPPRQPVSYVGGVDPTHLNKKRKRGSNKNSKKKSQKKKKAHDRRRNSKSPSEATPPPVKFYIGSKVLPDIEGEVIDLRKNDASAQDKASTKDTSKVSMGGWWAEKAKRKIELPASPQYTSAMNDRMINDSDSDSDVIEDVLSKLRTAGGSPSLIQFQLKRLEKTGFFKHSENLIAKEYAKHQKNRRYWKHSENLKTMSDAILEEYPEKMYVASPLPDFDDPKCTNAVTMVDIDNSDAADVTNSDTEESGETLREVSNCNTCQTTRSNTVISPAAVAAHKATPKIKIERIRWGAIKDHLDDMRSIPDGLWCPATSRSRPIGMTMSINKQRNADRNKSSGKLVSEQTNTRLLQAYAEIQLPSGEIVKGRVQLDTQSNVNYVLSKYAMPRTRRPWEATHCIGISNQVVKLGVPNQLTIMKDDKPIVVDTVRANPQMFRHGCVALLGTDAIHTLGIDLNYHVDNDEHVNLKFRHETLDNEVRRNKRSTSIQHFNNLKNRYSGIRTYQKQYVRSI